MIPAKVRFGQTLRTKLVLAGDAVGHLVPLLRDGNESHQSRGLPESLFARSPLHGTVASNRA